MSDIAVFGGGCFWCTEAVFKTLPGVIEVEPGYAGGKTANPTYEDVCTGQTGHAEVARIAYDADKLTYRELLDAFFKVHDPTTLNRQGHDVGTQYRSIILYTSEEQAKEAAEYIKSLDQTKSYASPVVTELEPLEKFWPAEDYHRDYYARNAQAPYCQAVIRPKLDKLKF
jgi:peptide-methionine (S)-S-oxide reductase